MKEFSPEVTEEELDRYMPFPENLTREEVREILKRNKIRREAERVELEKRKKAKIWTIIEIIETKGGRKRGIRIPKLMKEAKAKGLNELHTIFALNDMFSKQGDGYEINGVFKSSPYGMYCFAWSEKEGIRMYDILE